MSHQSAELVNASALSPSVRSLILRTDGPVFYKAGQWINIHVPVDGERIHRAYSIASSSACSPPNEIEIAVTRVSDGPVSTVLHDLPIGNRVEIDGPWGFFTRDGAPRDQAAIFIGTGTGLSPLRAMLQEELNSADNGPPLVLLFGCRMPKDILWADELQEWVRRYPRFKLEVTLSRPPPEWRGRAGHVQAHIIDLVKPQLPAHIYVCGLSDMVKDVREILKRDLQLPRQLIHTERYD